MVDFSKFTSAALWKARPEVGSRLERGTLGRQLSLSEGTAGHVWRSKRPIWSCDLVKDMCLPRSLDAEDDGLQGGVWFAVKTNAAVYGVVEMLGPDMVLPDDSLLLAAERLGIVLGEWMERDQMSA